MLIWLSADIKADHVTLNLFYYQQLLLYYTKVRDSFMCTNRGGVVDVALLITSAPRWRKTKEGTAEFLNWTALLPKVMTAASQNNRMQACSKCNTLFAVIFQHMDCSAILKDVSKWRWGTCLNFWNPLSVEHLYKHVFSVSERFTDYLHKKSHYYSL